MQKSKSSELHVQSRSGLYVLKRHFVIVSKCTAAVESMYIHLCLMWSCALPPFWLAGFVPHREEYIPSE